MSESDIHIPDEALEAGAAAYCKTYCGSRQWRNLSEKHKEDIRHRTRAACLAMLRAWPGMRRWPRTTTNGVISEIILPQEPKDD